MQDIVIEIGSNLFDGFYESIHCNCDEFIDYEHEDEAILKDLLYFSEDKADVVYEYDDFNQYKADVCTTFMELFVERVIDVLPSNITNNKDFKFDIAGEVEVYSPKYYNYTTDKCYINVQTNYKTLNMIKKHTLSLKGVQDYMIDNYTSYDGFISFLSNDKEDWEKTDIKDYKENMIIGLLDMLVILSDGEKVRYELNEDTYYRIEKITYTIPYCYWNDKKYEMYKFVGDVIRKIKSKYPIILGLNIYPFY